jgi:hypothetical protein
MVRTARILCMLILLMGPLGLRGVHACGDHGQAPQHGHSPEHACEHHADAATHDHQGEPRGAPGGPCDDCDMLAQQQVGSVASAPPMVPAPRAVPTRIPSVTTRTCLAVGRESRAQPPPVG